MNAMATANRSDGLTWEEFLDLPDEPELKHAELIDGVVVLNPPTRRHQRIVGRLYARIDAWTTQGHGRGEVTMDPGVKVATRRGYLPDVAWYPEERCGPPDADEPFQNPPALVAEVLSPSTRAVDTVRKRADYARQGVEELWLIDPAAGVALVNRPAAGAPGDFALVAEVHTGGALTSPLLPGFSVPMEDLLRR